MKTFITLFAWLSLCTTALAGNWEKSDFSKSDTVTHLSRKVYNGAVRPNWIDNSTYFWYRNHEAGGDTYYLVNAATGNKQRATSRETALALLPDSLRRSETGGSSPKKQPRGISPDGKYEAYVRDHNVCLRPLSPNGEKGKEIVLSTDGTFAMYYESDLQWSPDSRFLAVLLTRKAETRRIPLVESRPADRIQPRIHWIDYAKPGDVLPVSLPVLFNVETRRKVQLNTRTYENQFSLRLTGWRADSRAFTFEFNERGHQRYVVASVEPLSGKITHIVDEKSPTFISYINNFRYDLNDGRELLWSSERNGWRHLYRIDGNTGIVLNAVTEGQWVVRNVCRVDEAKGEVYLMASGRVKGEDPYNMHLCRVKLNGKGFTDLTPQDGMHRISFSPCGNYFVDVCSRPDLPPISSVRKTRDGSEVCVLERADVSKLQASGWAMPEVFHAKGRDGKTDIWGTIYRPYNFDPSKHYPVIEDIYAGPHDSFVPKDFVAVEYYMQGLAEQGYIVVKIDGMGTNNRSKAFHDKCWKNLKDAGFPDRIAWIKAAARRYPYMDIDRVGIYGWSAGGQNALAALLFHNDFYKAAVSFCGCHDNRMDKVWWNELWMGYPVDESYSQSSNVDNAHLLQGDLLIINGEMDNNVDPASTLQVVDALVKADKMFEQLYMPGKGHALGDRYEIHRMIDFFNRKLKN